MNNYKLQFAIFITNCVFFKSGIDLYFCLCLIKMADNLPEIFLHNI